MKRPKRSKVLVYKKYTETIHHVQCPHCHTDCIGVDRLIDRMRCWTCSEIVMLDWPDQIVKEQSNHGSCNRQQK